jgi:hypothetical protein
MEQREQILKGVSLLFLKFGFKSITMDDIARELGLSKKTLYQHFADKNDLVEQCVQSHLMHMEHCCNVAFQSGNNAIDNMIELTKKVGEHIRSMNPSALYDLKKYFKSSWDKLDKYRYEFIKQNIKKNLNQGKKEGIYYKDLDADIVTHIYTHLVQILTDPESFPKDLSFQLMHKELVKYHMRAICNENGLKILNQKIKEL